MVRKLSRWLGLPCWLRTVLLRAWGIRAEVMWEPVHKLVLVESPMINSTRTRLGSTTAKHLAPFLHQELSFQTPMNEGGSLGDSQSHVHLPTARDRMSLAAHH
ncbi:hypothetical protein PMIN03_013043 [Paraphaeosphaeria minitans]